MTSEAEDSGMGGLDSRDRFSAQDFSRLERKVDRLGEAMTKFLLIEERQTNLNNRIAAAETATATAKASMETLTNALSVRIETSEKLLAQWINRGMGIWALAITLWAMYQFFYPPHVH
jgi:hypothetical protein